MHRGWKVCAAAVLALALAAVLRDLQERVTAQTGDRTQAVRDALTPATAGAVRHVIFFLGDGMGDSEITMARNYALGAAGRLNLDSLPLTGAMTTYSVDEDDPAEKVYVTDSAASATSWATGLKTSNGRISTAARTGRSLTTILEIAQLRGFKTGSVTTAEVTDATPAALAAHVASRACQGPADMAACPKDRKRSGGLGSIAEQEVEHRLDVLLGGGYQRFAQPADDGRRVLDVALADGAQLVRTAAELERAKPGQPVLGLFAPGNMALEWKGLRAAEYPSNLDAPQTCQQRQRPATEPSLAQMTSRALELLGGAGGRDQFFLQVEGASIDKAAHAANPCGQIGETVAFDLAVKVGIDYARAHPDTLLIVTGDHAQSAQIVPVPFGDIHPAGLVSVLMTADRAPMAVAYGTNSSGGVQTHTGTQIRVAAMGPGAANVVGITDQSDLFRLMERAIGEPVIFGIPAVR